MSQQIVTGGPSLPQDLTISATPEFEGFASPGSGVLTLFEDVASGETPRFRITGYDVAATSQKTADILIDSAGNLIFGSPQFRVTSFETTPGDTSLGQNNYTNFSQVGSKDSFNSFWNGVHFQSFIITESAANIFPKLVFYARATTETDPTDFEWVLESANTGATAQSIRFKSFISGSQTGEGQGAIDFQTNIARALRVARSGRVGMGGIASPLAQCHIYQPSTSVAIPVLTLDQGDIDDTFINFIGTSAADGSRSISSDTTEDSTKFGAFRVEVNGVTKWVRIYNNES